MPKIPTTREELYNTLHTAAPDGDLVLDQWTWQLYACISGEYVKVGDMMRSEPLIWGYDLGQATIPGGWLEQPVTYVDQPIGVQVDEVLNGGWWVTAEQPGRIGPFTMRWNWSYTDQEQKAETKTEEPAGVKPKSPPKKGKERRDEFQPSPELDEYLSGYHVHK